jgi:acetoacetate decarboxylase
MPGYVKSQEEVARIEAFLAPSRFTCEEVGVYFKTSWEFAKEVLPPIFEPIGDEKAGTCDAYVNVTQYESAYCGTFDGAIVSLFCRYGDVDGYWMLTELMSPELPVTIGRELWGEVKKNGNGRIWRDGNSVRATGDRRGVEIIELNLDISGEEEGPRTDLTNGFDIKMYPHSNARGLQYPPLLNIWDIKYEWTSYREGTGTINWGHSIWDPTDTIPILSVDKAISGQYVGYWPLGQQIELQDPDNIYRQYMWGRGFDDPTWFPISKRFQGLDELNPLP